MIFRDSDKTYRRTASGLLECAYDPVHVAIRVLSLEKNLPSFARRQFF